MLLLKLSETQGEANIHGLLILVALVQRLIDEWIGQAAVNQKNQKGFHVIADFEHHFDEVTSVFEGPEESQPSQPTQKQQRWKQIIESILVSE